MRFFILRAEMLQAHMRIFLCGREARMAQKFLNCTEIRSALEQVRGEGVTQRMGGQTASGGKAHSGLFNDKLDAAGIHPTATRADEEGACAALLDFGKAMTVPHFQVCRERPCCVFAEGDDALLPPFSKNPDEPLR